MRVASRSDNAERAVVLAIRWMGFRLWPSLVLFWGCNGGTGDPAATSMKEAGATVGDAAPETPMTEPGGSRDAAPPAEAGAQPLRDGGRTTSSDPPEAGTPDAGNDAGIVDASVETATDGSLGGEGGKAMNAAEAGSPAGAAGASGAGGAGGSSGGAPQCRSNLSASSSPAVTAEPDASTNGNRVDSVIVISVDGLAPRFLEELIALGRAPNFERLQQEAGWTHNARADVSSTLTLPNHAAMLTGLPVSPEPGLPPTLAHGYAKDSLPALGETIHGANPNLAYVVSVFDSVHDVGRSTALFASKPSFRLFEQSYNVAGAIDSIGEDYGPCKIDRVLLEANPTLMTDAFLEQLAEEVPAFTLVHFADPDRTGHATVWGGAGWMQALQNMDEEIGRILLALDDANAAERTAVIVTADHGGTANQHTDSTDPNNFAIPFYLRAPGVAPGVNLYALLANREDPGAFNPPYDTTDPPLRGADVANAALGLLALPDIPGSLPGFQFAEISMDTDAGSN